MGSEGLGVADSAATAAATVVMAVDTVVMAVDTVVMAVDLVDDTVTASVVSRWVMVWV